MMAAEPGGMSYDETLQRVAAIIRDTETDLAEISSMSDQSFRLWLDQVIQRVAASLGIALGRAKAYVADVLTIIENAGITFKESFRDSYNQARRVQRRR